MAQLPLLPVCGRDVEQQGFFGWCDKIADSLADLVLNPAYILRLYQKIAVENLSEMFISNTDYREELVIYDQFLALDACWLYGFW